jgi:Holliday junction resolvase
VSLARHNPKRDASEPGIVAALEAAGAWVQRLSAYGVPDLLVGYHGQFFLIECKTGTRRRTDQEVQQATIAMLQRQGYRVGVCRTPEDALALVGAVH